jgi:hypothetical protein
LDPKQTPYQRVAELLRAYRNIIAKEELTKAGKSNSISEISRFINDIDINFDKKYIDLSHFIKWCTDNDYIGSDSVRVYRKEGGLTMIFPNEVEKIAIDILKDLTN